MNVDALMDGKSPDRDSPGAGALAEAEQWFARMRDGGSAADRAAFEQWRSEPQNAAAWARTTALWDGLAALDNDPAVERMVANAMWATRPRRRARWPAAAAIAACLVLACSAVLLSTLHAPPPPAVYATGPMQRRTVALADGSKVMLNVDTRIEARIGDDARRLTLSRGEALFDVVHDARRPFKVTAAGSEITDLGTRFQVSNREQQVKVTLLEGSVAIDRAKTGEHVRLRPGQQAVFAIGQGAIATHEVDIQVASSWTRGRLLFRGTPLSQVIAEVNRYTDTPIRLADPSLGSVPVSGTFPIGDSRSVAAGLQALLSLRADTSAPGRIVLRRR